MFRRFASKTGLPATVTSSAAIQQQFRFARILPQGFDYLENKVKELDVHAPGETLPQMTVNITRHDEFVFKNDEVKACTIPCDDGEAGIAPGHEYEINKLQPGTIVVETIKGNTLKFVTAGGFAHINPAGSVDINCAECIPVEDLDANLAQKELAAAQEVVKTAVGEKAKAVAELEVTMLEAAVASFKTTQ